LDELEPLVASRGQPQTTDFRGSTRSAAPAAGTFNELQLWAEKKRLEDKLNAGSYSGDDAASIRLDEINEELGILANSHPDKPAPLPKVKGKIQGHKLVIDKDDPWEDKNVTLPPADFTRVELIDQWGKIQKMKPSEVTRSPDYVDNGIQSLRVPIEPYTLKV